MAFFINNNALILWLSSSSPAGTMALSKVMACSGAFSHTSSSASHFPSRARRTSLTKNGKDLMARSKRKLRTVREAGRHGVGDKKRRNDVLLPQSDTKRWWGSSSERCFQTQIQQNTKRCRETSGWANLTSEGLQRLEESREQKVSAGC